MLDQKVKKHIDSARQILVGKIPDPKAQVEQITTAMIYKFMQDMDMENVELGGKAKYFVGDLKKYSWSHLISKELSGHERMDLYIRALVEFSKSDKIPELFRSIFKDTFLPYRDPETLSLFLKEINEFTYENSENLGNAFEYLLSILGSQGDAGQFRTPRHIIDFIVEVVDPKKNETILDPACGTAGFLISAYKHIRRIYSSNFKEDDYIPTFAETDNRDITTVEIQKNGKYKGDKLTPDDRKKLAKNIVGYDISPDMVRLSLVNLYLHNFSSPKIFEYDSLTYEDRWDETFDVILANPPFMTPKGGIRPHKRFQVQANRAEVLFVDYIAEHLKINGRAGIIVPEGIIFQTATAYKALRKMLVENELLWAVVSLPSGVFNPYSGVKTSILFLDKELAKKSDSIIFVKIENDGFDLGAQRRRVDQNDLPKAFDILKKQEEYIKSNGKPLTYGEVKDIAHIIHKDEIIENGEYNLNIDRYRKDVAAAFRESVLKIEESLLPYQKKFKEFYEQADKYGIQIKEIQKSIQPFVRYINDQQEAINEINEKLNEPVKKIQKAFEDINFSSMLSIVKELEKDLDKNKWPMMELEELIDTITPPTKIKKENYNENGRFPIIDQSQDEIAGWTDNEESLIFSNQPLVIFGDHTCVIKYSDKPFAQGADGIKVLKTKENLIPKFLYYLLKVNPIKADGYQRHFSKLKKYKIPVPSIEIQKQVINEFDEYQKVIDGAIQIVNNWRPVLDVSPDWAKYDFEDICTLEYGSSLPQKNRRKGEYPVMGSNGRCGLHNEFLIKGPAIIVGRKGSAGEVVWEDKNCYPIDTTYYVKVKNSKIVNLKFLYFILKSFNLQKLKGGAGIPGLNRNDVYSKIKIPLPSMEVQKNIVSRIEAEENIVKANYDLVENFNKKMKERIDQIWGK